MDGLLDYYLLGVALGLGVAAGAGRVGAILERVLATAALAGGVVIAVLAAGLVWAGPFAGLVLGTVFLRRLPRQAALAAVVGAALLAFVPVAGYLVALATPVVGTRLGRRAGSRYAGLRVLARD